MFDIYSQKVILVKNTELFNKLKSNHYRFIDKRMFKWLKNKLKRSKQSRSTKG